MEIRTQVSLADYTTLKVGGLAEYFCEVATVEELEQARQFAQQTAVPVLILGTGSNVLVSDKGFAGLVVLNRITGKTYQESDHDQVSLTVGAGENFDATVADTVQGGYWGLENLSHIPGTVGATPVQNVGAYGVEVADLIVEVAIFNIVTGEQKTVTNDECQFGYRDSWFKTSEGRQWCITSVTFLLTRQPKSKLDYKDLVNLRNVDKLTSVEVRNKVISIRSRKFPDWQTIGTAGSFFKNPIIPVAEADKLVSIYPELPVFPVDERNVKVSLGYILDKICNLKGYKEHSVRLYEKQALVLINEGTSASAVIDFANGIKNRVQEKTGIIIEQEVTAV